VPKLLPSLQGAVQFAAQEAVETLAHFHRKIAGGGERAGSGKELRLIRFVSAACSIAIRRVGVSEKFLGYTRGGAQPHALQPSAARNSAF
jgi:hypothetical protein